ncbi:MAG: zinc-dependent alcohol dehydrogenase family protein [Nitrospinota bacterium]
MRAMIVEEFGGPEVFKPATIPRPEIRPGHLLLRVEATCVNPLDCKLRSLPLPFSPPLPAVLHTDVAGVVEEVGADVTGFRPGDEVYASAGSVGGYSGALAEFMLADAALAAHKPRSLGMGEAAALPLVAITAWESLVDRGRVGPGDRVLIHGAAGGVGHVAIQIAKTLGAEVFATGSSEEKLAIGRELGADGVINYREESVADYLGRVTEGRGFDVVLDTVGGENLERSFEAARANGTVVTIAGGGGHDLTWMQAKSLTLHVESMLLPLIRNAGRAAQGEILRNVTQLVEEGRLKPLIDPNVFTIDQVAQAHRHLESGKAVGKVVLTRQ